MSRKTSTTIIIVVTTLWIVNFVCTLVVDGYEPSESVNAVFASIIGGLVAVGTKGSDDDGQP